MSTSKNIPSIKHRHKFKVIQAWEEFRVKGETMVRERKRWNVCVECQHKNELRVNEYESYGTIKLSTRLVDELHPSVVPLATYLLMELYKSKNRRRWQSLHNKLLSNWEFVLIDEVVEFLHRYGYLIKTYQRNKERLYYWDVVNVRYNEEFIAEIKDFLNIHDYFPERWEQDPFPKFNVRPQTMEGNQIMQILLKQKKSYEKIGQASLYDQYGDVIATTQKNRRQYFRLIRSLYGLYKVVESGRTSYWKTFCQELFGDTKALSSKYKKALQRILGKELSEYGLYTRREEILLSGLFNWTYNNSENTSRAYKSYVPIPSEIFTSMKITAWQAPYLLIIENQDLFLDLVNRGYLTMGEWNVMFSAGYLSREHIEIIRQASCIGLREVYVWPDLDPYGYLIVLDIKKKLVQHHVHIPVYIFGYDINWFAKSPKYKKLEKPDIKAIKNILRNNVPRSIKEVLQLMKSRGEKGEQEILINLLVDQNFSQVLKDEAVRIDLHE